MHKLSKFKLQILEGGNKVDLISIEWHIEIDV